MNSSETSSKLPLLALSVGAFAIGVTEFAPMGMLPVIADGVNVSIPTAGLLVTAYAIGVMVGAPVMTLLFGRFGKRTALIALMAIFTLGNLMSALSPDYWTLLAARLFTSLNHGAFFGLGAVVAASVVPPDKRASAVAMMFMGLTIANLGGVPAATWIGQQIGWRESFATTALLGIITMFALAAALPKGGSARPVAIRQELKVLIRPEVLFALFTTVFSASAMFTLYTYLAPILHSLAGADDDFITLALMLIGLGFTVGNWLGGKLADWSPDGASAIFMGLLALIMLVSPYFLVNQTSAGILLFVWGIAAFAIVPPVQTRVMIFAAEAPGLASSINIGAFNLGNGIGAALGSWIIAAGLGYAAVPVAGAFSAAAGLGLIWLGSSQARRKAALAA